MDGSIREEASSMKKFHLQYLALILTFFLGLREGNIALWPSGCDEPPQVFPYRAETLPPAVRSALEKGMIFSTSEEALETVENILS